jgi:hypothetical protein
MLHSSGVVSSEKSFAQARIASPNSVVNEKAITLITEREAVGNCLRLPRPSLP